MFEIRNAQAADVDATIAALGEAFAPDPLIGYFFRDNPAGIRAGAMAFFSILLRARLALAMPALVLQQGDDIMGLAMGYDISRPNWPAALSAQWQQLETDIPGLAARFAAYDQIAEAHFPAEPHYYLGVIGVRPSLQRVGAGKALLDAFCARSRADPASHGVYLETSSPGSLQFYYRNGFQLRGEGDLDGMPLWCVYQPS